MTQEELNERIRKHELWLQGKEGGERLDIGAQYDVRGLDFDGRDLRSAIFQGADLSFTSFYAANLKNAYLDEAIFDHTNFDGATITYNVYLILRL
ncbi:MAG: pentapeptide repeat-containing protein, partial [Clostridiales bacterium]|nr:pentapeptide repeat-containing protein [Clostridiales bacterium]